MHNDLCHKYVYGKKWMKSHTGIGHYITFQMWGYKQYDVISACGQRFYWDSCSKEPLEKCKKCLAYEKRLNHQTAADVKHMYELEERQVSASF
jgi:hypothetical protein